VGLFGGCTYSDTPLLPESEGLENEAFTGRFAVSDRGRLNYWTVTRQGRGYLVTPTGDKKEPFTATLHPFDSQFSLLQSGPMVIVGDKRGYSYTLINIGENFLLIRLISCNKSVAKQAKLDVERADSYTCLVKSRDQVVTLARRTAAQSLDPKDMFAALRVGESGAQAD
jgi:hypothetical protein